MKKLAAGFILIFLLSACGTDSSYEVSMERDLYFQKDKTSAFEIKVTDKDQPAEGLDISAELNMTDMDHGTYEVSFKEKGDGIYTGEAELPMAGKWEMIYTLEKDGKASEKVMEYEVKEPAGAAMINGEWITNEDLEFYRFINELHLAIKAEEAGEKYQGDELEDVLTGLESEKESIQDQNTLLTQIIRLRAVAMLGSEKGYQAEKKEIEKELNMVRGQYDQFKIAKKMISEFGEDKFWNKEQTQYELIILTQKVQADLIAKVKKENPDVNEQEVLYLAKKQYEDLLVSQVHSLDIEIL